MEAATLSPVSSSASTRKLHAAADERLVAGLRAGDERCFEVIYDRYHLPLLSFCRHMVGTREEAEDALQQVFVSAHGQLVRDARPVQLRAWLYAVARNRCLSVLRARRETVAIDAIAEPSSDGLAVAAEVQQRQDLKDILRDLARLPDDQRAALVLAELEDLSHDEIAVALDVRKDKVKALVFQAREALMGFREARDADCGEIREQLATLRGGALRRTSLQRHLAICPGCAAFKADVKRQRAALGAVLPVVPALALRDQVLSAVQAASTGAGAVTGSAGVAAGVGAVASGGAGSAAGVAVSGGSGLLAAVASSGVAVKVLATVALVASAGGGAVAVERATDDPPARRAPVTRPVSGTPASAVASPVATATATATTATSVPAPVTVPTSATAPGAAVAAAAKARAAQRKAAGRANGRAGKATTAGASAVAKGKPATTGKATAGANGRSSGASAGKAVGRPVSTGAKASKPAASGRSGTGVAPVKPTTKAKTKTVPAPANKPASTPGSASGRPPSG